MWLKRFTHEHGWMSFVYKFTYTILAYFLIRSSVSWMRLANECSRGSTKINDLSLRTSWFVRIFCIIFIDCNWLGSAVDVQRKFTISFRWVLTPVLYYPFLYDYCDWLASVLEILRKLTISFLVCLSKNKRK